MLIKNVSLTL